MMKKVLALLLAVAMLACLCACGDDSSKKDKKDTEKTKTTASKIQADTLNFDLKVLNKDTGRWKSIKNSTEPLFPSTSSWEPGQVEIKVLKIENTGTLDLKWIAKFESEDDLSALAEVIDVYALGSTTKIGYPEDRTLDGYTKVGTLAELVNSIEELAWGELGVDEACYLSIALKIRENLGNEYQNLSSGNFDIRILAIELTEVDPDNNKYDEPTIFETTTTTTTEDWIQMDGEEHFNDATMAW